MVRKVMTESDLVVACKNIGFDLTCGACAGQFYTGALLGEHTCLERADRDAGRTKQRPPWRSRRSVPSERRPSASSSLRRFKPRRSAIASTQIESPSIALVCSANATSTCASATIAFAWRRRAQSGM